MIIHTWEGAELQMTEAVAAIFPFYNYDDFPDNFCGAGQGIWEKLVPDYLRSSKIITGEEPVIVKISPACKGHDLDWEFAHPSWDDFHEGNSRLYANIKSIVEARTIKGTITQYYLLRFPAIYAHAVDTAGRKIFWRMKQKQGHPIPRSAAWLL